MCVCARVCVCVHSNLLPLTLEAKASYTEWYDTNLYGKILINKSLTEKHRFMVLLKIAVARTNITLVRKLIETPARKLIETVARKLIETVARKLIESIGENSLKLSNTSANAMLHIYVVLHGVMLNLMHGVVYPPHPYLYNLLSL